MDSLTHHRHPALGLTVGYMVPIIPSVLVNYACATMKIPRKNFILMVAVGMFPVPNFGPLRLWGRRLV
ncbi:VTT domain-containing protein [Limosilactobacillus fermentum]|uniref:VTT domain-containing protein n=1 Tax=Limosilactobacillus fermentum TaxID=1613 RepID=UPI0021A8219E|nr:VTT domain-containing protein [Limosilactobacillus fermentum]